MLAGDVEPVGRIRVDRAAVVIVMTGDGIVVRRIGGIVQLDVSEQILSGIVIEVGEILLVGIFEDNLHSLERSYR